MDDLNNTESVEVEGQPYQGDLGDLVSEESIETINKISLNKKLMLKISTMEITNHSMHWMRLSAKLKN